MFLSKKSIGYIMNKKCIRKAKNVTWRKYVFIVNEKCLCYHVYKS